MKKKIILSILRFEKRRLLKKKARLEKELNETNEFLLKIEVE